MPLSEYRLDGLEPDNPLAFFALLGLLRALTATDEEMEPALRVHARVYWTEAPTRPVLVTRVSLSPEDLARRADAGIRRLAEHHEFGDRADLNYTQSEAREVLREAARAAASTSRYRADLLAALMSDGTVESKSGKKTDDPRIQPTPICLLFGQGHQHFLPRLRDVPRWQPEEHEEPARQGEEVIEHLVATLFHPWTRADAMLSSFRWDPDEIARYALMAGNPTDAKYKLGTQLGANRLAAVGISVLTAAPAYGGNRLAIIGGHYDSQGFSLAWPIWREPATLCSIRWMLAHPDLRTGGLRPLGVEQVMVSRRIQLDKYFSFTRAQPVSAMGS
ncbi:type I-G CRISPR-associated protein, Cas3-extension family [Alicyclobacillus mali (ex Roth et al. 2021)]|uniref:type I-G CRISPR-associated protein, Cas3-extension family n=2 Tax=Alicyclobacillus mali (ex Roth et al. 2021) TaxID=1123961 RepID=UPI001A8E9032|nr:hypothetical protein [Alicyclobacillus mali (ex Roth et al. 2021)]